MRLLYDQTAVFDELSKIIIRQSDVANQLKAESWCQQCDRSSNSERYQGARSEMTATAARVVELQGKYNALGERVFNRFGKCCK